MESFLSLWKPAPRMGDVIGGTFLLPIKTPISADNVPPESIFTPDILVDYQKNKGRSMVAVVCVDGSSHYVSQDDWDDIGVKFLQLGDSDPDVVPTSEEIELFEQIISSFEDSGGCVGVCGTDGFNRVGFFCVSFMVSMGWAVERAIASYAIARPPGIYNSALLDELCRLYGGNPTYVEPPSWLPTPVLQPSDVHIGDLIDDTGVIKAIHNICEGLGYTGSPSAFPGAQPISLDRENMKTLSKHYMATWKADGERYMMVLMNGKTMMVDREYRVFLVHNLSFPRRGGGLIDGTVLDGELVVDMDNRHPIPRYLVYDILSYDGHLVGKRPLIERMKIVEHDIIAPRKADPTIDPSKAPFAVRAKQHFPIKQAAQIHAKLFPQLTHPNDGFIFTPSGPYLAGVCTTLLKWKPADLNTVDFVCRVMVRDTDHLTLDTLIADLYLLNGDEFIYHAALPLDSVEQALSVDGRVVECAFIDSKWSVVRVRRDKAGPNSVITANGVFRSIQHGVGLDELLSFIHTM